MSYGKKLTILTMVMGLSFSCYAYDANNFQPIMITSQSDVDGPNAFVDALYAGTAAQASGDANVQNAGAFSQIEPNDTVISADNNMLLDAGSAMVKKVSDPQLDSQDANVNDPNAVKAHSAAFGVEVKSTIEERLQTLISVDFVNTPIEDVLRLMAEQANVDLVKSPKVVGTVTAKLTAVPLEEALSNILAINGYAYITTKNMIRVAPINEISDKSEMQVNRIYRVTYADVKEVEKSLKRFVSKSGSISANPGTSNLIITDTESKMKAIDTFIQEIDRITPQVLVEARIYDITGKDSLDLGINWFAGTQTQFSTDENGNKLVSGVHDPFMRGGFNSTTSKTDSTTGTFKFGWVNDNIANVVELKAQQEKIDAKLLANPRVLVLDNEKAEIKIIQQIPYLQLSQGGGNNSMFGTTEFKEVGVTLDVTPHVTRDRLIRLQLKPKFSVQTGTVDFDVDNIAYPQPVIAERQGDTTLLIKDAQTVVLGGLKKKDVIKQVNKIPILGDLPLIGMAFRANSDQIINSELVVFITPTIIESPVLTELEKGQLAHTEFTGPVTTPGLLEKDLEKNKNNK
jgi:type IV pilus assembly protein PilQ